MQKETYLKQVSDKETEIILELLSATADVSGDIVEFGCYRGDTSLLLEKFIEKDLEFRKGKEFFDNDGGSKKLWLYDSFAGLPEKSNFDNSVAGDNFRAGELLVSKAEVVMRFKKAGLRVPRIRKNFFENLNPDTDLPPKISFAFLDGDLYSSILTSLKLVWSKLSDGAIVVVHDYNNPELPGVTKAVEEWGQAHGFRLEVRESLAIVRV